MESSHLVIFLKSGKFIMKFNVFRCISLSDTLFWTGAKGSNTNTLTSDPAPNFIWCLKNTPKPIQTPVPLRPSAGRNPDQGHFSLNDFYAWATCNGQNSTE